MKVVCIKKFRSTNLKYELTYGKIYELIPKFPNDTLDDYRIECDRGFVEYYSKDIFVTLEDWREQQLNKITNEL
jgi:hypothetical protein